MAGGWNPNLGGSMIKDEIREASQGRSSLKFILRIVEGTMGILSAQGVVLLIFSKDHTDH